MRTTIRLPDELYDEVRRRSVHQGSTVTSFIEAALRQALDEADQPRTAFVVDAVTGTGLCPGVHLDESASLLDLMDS